MYMTLQLNSLLTLMSMTLQLNSFLFTCVLCCRLLNGVRVLASYDINEKICHDA